VRPLIGNAFVDPETPGETIVDAVNRRGRPTQVRVTCTGFQSSLEDGVNGALLLMEPQSDHGRS
jgi:two-component system CheB/CheR fusion protein